MVKRVEAELKMDVSDVIKAANITASIRPATPEERRGGEFAIGLMLVGYVRSSFILRITYPQSSVTPLLAGPSGHCPPGM